MEKFVGIAFWLAAFIGLCALIQSTLTPSQEKSVEKGIQDGTNTAVEGLESARHWMNGALEGPKKAAAKFQKENTFSNWLQANGG